MHPDSCDLVLLEFIEYLPAIASEIGSFTRSPGTSLPALPQAHLLSSSAALYSRLVQFLFCGNVQVIWSCPQVSEVGENLMPSPISCQFWWLLLCCFILPVQEQSAKSLQEMGHRLRLEAVLSRRILTVGEGMRRPGSREVGHQRGWG